MDRRMSQRRLGQGPPSRRRPALASAMRAAHQHGSARRLPCLMSRHITAEALQLREARAVGEDVLRSDPSSHHLAKLRCLHRQHGAILPGTHVQA